MDPIVVAAGTALVTAMTTDAWQQAQAGTVALWRRFRPEQAQTVETELAEVRDQMLTARRNGDDETEQALVGEWRGRLARLLRQDPQAAAELRRVLDDVLTPALSIADRTQIGSIVLNATAEGNSRIYQAGRDLHTTEPQDTL